VLAEEARILGLTVNDMKTVTWKKANYKAHLDEADRLREAIAAEAELDLTDYDMSPYADILTVTPPDPHQVDRLAAVRVLDRWNDLAGGAETAMPQPSEHRAVSELVPYALGILAGDTNTDPQVLANVMQLLRYEKPMTPAVAQYLLGRDDGGLVVAAFDDLLDQDVYLNGWQTWWLHDPVARRLEFLSGARASRRIKWSSEAFSSAEQSPILGAYAALTLARHKQISLESLLGLYNRGSVTVRPILVAAIAHLKPTADVKRALSDDSRLYSWVYTWAMSDA